MLMAAPHSESTGERQAFERGRIAQRLDEFDQHFKDINGSVERTAAELKKLTKQISDLAEGARRAAERVIIEAETLATETERRREELAHAKGLADDETEAADRTWSRRDRVIATVLGLIGLVAVALGEPWN